MNGLFSLAARHWLLVLHSIVAIPFGVLALARPWAMHREAAHPIGRTPHV